MVSRSAVLATLLLAGSGAAADSQFRLRPGMMGVADIGTTTCAFFNELHYHGPTGTQQQALTWMQGYLYAKNGSTIDAILAGLPPDNAWNFDSLSAVIVDYCRTNPEARVSTAAVALAERLLAGDSGQR